MPAKKKSAIKGKRIIQKRESMRGKRNAGRIKTRASEPSCECPDVKLVEWDFKEHQWDGKTFYAKRMGLFLGLPFGIGKKIEKTMDEIIEKKYILSRPVQIMYTHGLFSGMVLVGLKNAPKSPDDNVMIFQKARVFSKIHTGPYNKMSDSKRDLNKFVKQKTGHKAKNFYLWYASCPGCFENKNPKTVIFARV